MAFNPYLPADLSAYPTRERLTIRLAAALAYLVLRLLALTLRLDRENLRDLADPLHGHFPTDTPIVYVFWHNRILAATSFFQRRGIVVMTSQSKDGDIIARVIQFFGFGAARGSATRGSIQALKGMARCLRDGHDAAFTIDGPKGPRYEAKPGAVMLARLSGAPLQPIDICVASYWTIKSWDRFRIPKPFSRGKIFYGKPIHVPRDADEAELATRNAELQAELDRLRAESNAWTGTGDGE
jgi:lysophospholipid acyltransferase (LPLAT)-like uncharacterized protein